MAESDNRGNPTGDPDKPLTAGMFLRLMKAAWASEDYKQSTLAILTPVLENVCAEIVQLRSQVSRQAGQIADLRNQLSQQDHRIADLEKLQQHQDTQKRLHNIKVSGLGTTSELETKQKFVDIIKTCMNVDLEMSDFTARVPPSMPAATSDVNKTTRGSRNPPPITLTFNSIWLRRHLYSKRTSLKGTDVYLSDDLTKEEGSLFYACRQLSKQKKIKSTWTFMNKIYVLTTNDERVEIANKEQLDSLFMSQERDIQQESFMTCHSFEGFSSSELQATNLAADLRKQSIERELVSLELQKVLGNTMGNTSGNTTNPFV